MSLSSFFSSLSDPRRSVGRRTDLPQLLSMVTLSYLCGYTGYRPIARFCKVYSIELTALLSLRHPVPSHVTFREVLQQLDQRSLIEAFNSWASVAGELAGVDWVSGDGKTLNSTVSDCHGKNQNFEAVVSLFGQNSGVVYALGAYKNKDKGQAEANVLRILLEKLGAMGLTISLDALHTQKND